MGLAVAENADRLTRKVTMAADAAVVLSTPVDTGRARSNWQASLNNPATGIAEPVSAQDAITAAATVVSKYNGDRHHEIHLTNNLPYIGRLNDGYSAQAPEGFVEHAVLAGASQVKGVQLTITNGVRE